MKQVLVFSAVSLVAAISMGCSTSTQYAHANSPAADCNTLAQTENSAWVHGEGAPGGQAQIGYGRSMEKMTAERRELAASCASGSNESM